MVVVVLDQLISPFTIPRLIGRDRFTVEVTVVGMNWGPNPRPLCLASGLEEKETMGLIFASMKYQDDATDPCPKRGAR